MQRKLIGTMIAAAFFASATQAHATAAYTFTDLGTLGGIYSDANAINNAGWVVGYASIAGNVTTNATLWKDGAATDLTPGGAGSEAYAINGKGQVAGYVVAADSYHATVWDGKTATTLNSPGTASSFAYGINSAGQVAGNAGAAAYATLWNNGAAAMLGPDGYSTRASAINDTGQVAGSVMLRRDNAAVWNGTKLTVLGALNLGSPGSEYQSWANAINNAGQVAGAFSLIGGASHATVWNGTTATDLGTLAGWSDSAAIAINNAGQVVGRAYIPYTNSAANHAVLWSGGMTTDLNSFLDASTVQAGWVLNAASGINDNGWIVGAASNSLLGINRHAFLLAPASSFPSAISPSVAEPDTYILFIAGLGVMGLIARRRTAG